jgi:hypothetical protein
MSPWLENRKGNEKTYLKVPFGIRKFRIRRLRWPQRHLSGIGKAETRYGHQWVQSDRRSKIKNLRAALNVGSDGNQFWILSHYELRD